MLFTMECALSSIHLLTVSYSGNVTLESLIFVAIFCYSKFSIIKFDSFEVIIYHLLILEALVPGAGSFEIAAYTMLKKDSEQLKGRAKLGALVRFCHCQTVVGVPISAEEDNILRRSDTWLAKLCVGSPQNFDVFSKPPTSCRGLFNISNYF